MKSIWTKEEVSLLREQFKLHKTRELTPLFPGKTYYAIKEKANILGLKKNKKYFHFSDEQAKRLTDIYSNTSNQDIAKEFGCEIGTINWKAHKLKLKKSIEFIAEVAKANFTEDHPARKFFFKKGHDTYTKGKRQQDFMSAEGYEVCKSNYFKKGHIPGNTKPVGYEFQTTDGYIRVKVAEPNVFRFKHHVVWEENFGPIPKDYNVQFRNKIGSDCSPGNLYIITRRDQLLTENGSMAVPEELKPTYQLLRNLNKKIKKYETDKS